MPCESLRQWVAAARKPFSTIAVLHAECIRCQKTCTRCLRIVLILPFSNCNQNTPRKVLNLRAPQELHAPKGGGQSTICASPVEPHDDHIGGARYQTVTCMGWVVAELREQRREDVPRKVGYSSNREALPPPRGRKDASLYELQEPWDMVLINTPA